MENFFDNLKKGVSVALNGTEKIAKVVKDKTVNAYDTTKLNLALNSTEGKMNKHYQKIGEIIYQQYKDNRNVGEEIEAYCERFDTPPANFTFSPGGFTKEEAIKALEERFTEIK